MIANKRLELVYPSVAAVVASVLIALTVTDDSEECALQILNGATCLRNPIHTIGKTGTISMILGKILFIYNQIPRYGAGILEAFS